MSNRIVLNTEQVLSIASQIEADNEELRDLLEQSRATLTGLSTVWTGSAADQTRSAYESFSNKFFETYYELLEQYVRFLRSNVAEQYSQAESTNTRLADAFE